MTWLYFGVAEIIRPGAKFAKQIESYIFKQLNDNLSNHERRIFRGKVTQFRLANKLDAVILGCTELPLVYGESVDADLVIDTLRVLAEGALERYYNL